MKRCALYLANFKIRYAEVIHCISIDVFCDTHRHFEFLNLSF